MLNSLNQLSYIPYRYLATGDQVLSCSFAHRIGESTAYKLIKEVCNVLVIILQPLYVKSPTMEEFRNIAEGFYKRWNFPNCLGAVDGKHVTIQAPPNSGSTYYNYKKTFSIALMAACDYKYCFTLVDVGAYGCQNDASVFAESDFGIALSNGALPLPNNEILPGTNEAVPYMFIGDEGFQLSKNFMRPHSGRLLEPRKRIFNYRLSRARNTIENAFGILASRWRVFRKPIGFLPETVDKVISATVCLHNFLITEENNPGHGPQQIYCPNNYTDSSNDNGVILPGEWRNEESHGLRDLAPTSAHRAAQAAYELREKLTDYFSMPAGEVPWQWNYIRRGCHGEDISKIM